MPGHVLVSPQRVVPRLSDLSQPEITDLFSTVQKVEHMLAAIYFAPGEPSSGTASGGAVERSGSFNIAIQDGVDAGQTVPHVHCHVIPRPRGQEVSDAIYEKMTAEEGNVGGALWDERVGSRPMPSGQFPKVDDAARKARGKEEMDKEADWYRGLMGKLDE